MPSFYADRATGIYGSSANTYQFIYNSKQNNYECNLDEFENCFKILSSENNFFHVNRKPISFAHTLLFRGSELRLSISASKNACRSKKNTLLKDLKTGSWLNPHYYNVNKRLYELFKSCAAELGGFYCYMFRDDMCYVCGDAEAQRVLISGSDKMAVFFEFKSISEFMCPGGKTEPKAVASSDALGNMAVFGPWLDKLFDDIKFPREQRNTAKHLIAFHEMGHRNNDDKLTRRVLAEAYSGWKNRDIRFFSLKDGYTLHMISSEILADNYAIKELKKRNIELDPYYYRLLHSAYKGPTGLLINNLMQSIKKPEEKIEFQKRYNQLVKFFENYNSRMKKHLEELIKKYLVESEVAARKDFDVNVKGPAVKQGVIVNYEMLDNGIANERVMNEFSKIIWRNEEARKGIEVIVRSEWKKYTDLVRKFCGDKADIILNASDTSIHF